MEYKNIIPLLLLKQQQHKGTETTTTQEYKNIIPLLLLKQQQHKGTSGI